MAKGTPTQKPSINDERLFDLVRHQRSELFTAGLITEEEYFLITSSHPLATSPAGGSPSRERLEAYDTLRDKTEALRSFVETLLTEAGEVVECYSLRLPDIEEPCMKRLEATIAQAGELGLGGTPETKAREVDAQVQKFIQSCDFSVWQLYCTITAAVAGVFSYRIEHMQGHDATLVLTYPHGPSSSNYARPCIKLRKVPEAPAKGPFAALEQSKEGYIVVECADWAAQFSLGTPASVILDGLRPYCKWGQSRIAVLPLL